MRKKLINNSELKKFIIANIGIFFLTLSINLLAWKLKLVSAGVSGYALAISYLTGISVGILLLIINGFIMLLNWILLGKSAGAKALYGYIIFSISVDLTRMLFNIHQTPSTSIQNQILYLSILAILISIFISMIIASGYSVGSYSAMYPVINKFINITPAKLFIICDSILTLITWSLFGFEKAAILFVHAVILSISLKYILSPIKQLID